MRINGRLWILDIRLDIPSTETAVIVTADKLATFTVPTNGANAFRVIVPKFGYLRPKVPEDYTARLKADQ